MKSYPQVTTGAPLEPRNLGKAFLVQAQASPHSWPPGDHCRTELHGQGWFQTVGTLAVACKKE